MNLNLGSKIKELRLNKSITQDALASSLGVTSQAVSRWESGGSYPDMELIPSLANFFNITIDELFGYKNNRSELIQNIIDKVNAFNIKGRSDALWIDECLTILREGLAEFPKNEELLIVLADVLMEAGYRQFQEHSYYDDNGIRNHNYNIHNKNSYWQEAIKICENLYSNTTNQNIITKAISILVLLYKNIGFFEKSVKFALKMPNIDNSKELLLIKATDSLEQTKYIGEYLLKEIPEVSHQIIHSIINNKNNYDTNMPIDKLKKIIDLYYLIFDDGNMGIYHGDLIKYYLYLSRLEYDKGYDNEAFASLDKALHHSKELEKLPIGTHYYTSSLLKENSYTIKAPIKVSNMLPDDWPWWHLPEVDETSLRIKNDPRWTVWVNKCNE